MGYKLHSKSHKIITLVVVVLAIALVATTWQLLLQHTARVERI